MTEKDFDLIKEVINECLKYGNIYQAIGFVTLFRHFQVIDDRVMESLYSCIRKGRFVTCSMYDKLKEME